MRDGIIQLTSTEIDELKRLENELTEIKNKIRSYKDSVIRSHGCKDTIGKMSYKIVRRNYLGGTRDEEIRKFLAWRYQWFIDDHNYIIPRYSYVTLDGRKGDDVYIMGKEDIEFVPLDGCTYEEAERILKDDKKKKDI